MQLETTREYDKFKSLEGNRSIDKAHLKRLANAIAKRPELVEAVPILVNERFEVIDGQHRLEVLKQLGLQISYIQMTGLDLKDVQVLNSTSKTWGPVDYARSYARQGNPHYQTYLQFREQFPYGHKILMGYLAGTTKGGSAGARFRNGLFEVTDVEKADTHLNYLDDIREVIPHIAHRPTFALALRRAFESPVYDHKRMLKKLEIANHIIQQHDNQADYLRDIETVYNYKGHGEDVRLF